MQASLERIRARRDGTGIDGGFTLIELLIVIVILGILAAIVVFAVIGVTGSSAKSACQSDFKTIETATEAYKAQTNNLATQVTQLGTTATVTSQTVGPWLNSKDLSSVSGALSAKGAMVNSGHYAILLTNGTIKNGTTAVVDGAISGNQTHAVGGGTIMIFGQSGKALGTTISACNGGI